MKEYMKPEVEYVQLIADEAITDEPKLSMGVEPYAS